MKSFWDQRYDTDEFVYGREPNDFFATSILSMRPGKVLLPGEGEGRNAIYAAELGWSVDAFDQSQVAMDKALKFAKEKSVHINFKACDLEGFPFKKANYDAVGLIFFHVPPALRKLLHQKAMESLKQGGELIMEAFHTTQLGMNSGGPRSPEMLYDKNILLEDFRELQVELMEETEVDLEEGLFHGGLAKVIRFRGRKK